MVYEKIMSVHNALGVLADRVDKETWAMLRLVRAELMDAADMAAEIENRFTLIQEHNKNAGRDNDKEGNRKVA